MLKKYKVKVNGNEYNVEVEEVIENIQPTTNTVKDVTTSKPEKKAFRMDRKAFISKNWI